MKRRRFLQTVGASALSFPWFSNEALRGADAAEPVQRLVCIGLDLSLRPESFFPAGEGSEYELTPLLKPLERWRERMTVFSQLDHPGVMGGHAGVHAFLSGVRREQSGSFADGCVSIDQFVEEQRGGLTRFPSLCLGVGGGDCISWTRSGIAVPKIENPAAVFDLLFKPQPAGVRETRRAKIAENESVLALIQADARRVAPKLDRYDRDKLEEFKNALREFERTTQTNAAWLDKPLPKTDADPPPRSISGCLEKVRATYDVMALALQSDATRIITLNIGTGLPVTNIPGVKRSYHDLSHSGKDPDKLRQLHLIESALVAEFDRFLDKLAGLRDFGGGSLLDHTAVLFGSGMGNASSHSNMNLPVLLAGGDFRHGRHLFFQKTGRKQTALCNLFVTLLQHMGIERDHFGSSDGNLNELLS